ncbi:MAG TPA: TrkH family potassium uptake protein [Prolixibacteraceae bacterium]|nr:TrkH family potassium uptake protein [Prolixibacteraceae bacterium]
MINWRIIVKVLSRGLVILSFSFLSCVGVALIYREPTFPFFLSALISISLGGLFFLLSRGHDKQQTIDRKEAYLAVVFTWLMMGISGALPYLISGAIPNGTDAWFESVSGFSTTGSSILVDIEALPRSILFWRSLTHWIGGIGIIVLVIIVMPSLRMGSYNLFTLESSLQDKIQFRMISVGKRLLFIYVVLTLAEIIFLLLGGMSLFDSVCHAFGTVATGGFSPKNDSIAGYSPYIQYVIMVFMLLAGTNFVIHYYLFKRDFKKIWENDELRFYGFMVLLIGTVITLLLVVRMHKPVEEAFRESFFQVISIITCTGFATTDYQLWPVVGWGIIFLSMFLGGSTGSTAGGIKMARHLVLLKNIRNTLRQMVSPNAIIPLKLNRKTISSENNASILSFVSMYAGIYILGSLLMMLIGLDPKTALSSVATCMAGIGPGLGSVGPVNNFFHLPDLAKWILTLLMLLGRLEIYTLILLFSPRFWRV